MSLMCSIYSDIPSILTIAQVLRLSLGRINELTSGHIINVMSNDCEKLLHMCTFLPTFVAAPLMLIIVACCSYNLMGYPALIGLGIVLLMLPFQGYKTRFAEKIEAMLLIFYHFSSCHLSILKVQTSGGK